MEDQTLPALRRDLEFYPVQLRGKAYVLIRDPLGLTQEGKAVEIPLYQLMTLLDGRTTVRDLQTALMRQGGGMLVSSDEVKSLLAHLDESFLLESEKFRKAKEAVIAEYVSKKVRPSSHSGRAYPADPQEVRQKLDEILSLDPDAQNPEGSLIALVAPHIDLSVGGRVYSKAYRLLKGTSPKTVILLGTGHQMAQDLFALSEKAFETPLGVAECNRAWVERLRAAGGASLAANDFVHRGEHSIEFQLLFLQHLLPKDSFTIVPILCGNLQTTLPEYTRPAFIEKAGPMLEALKDLLGRHGDETLVVAGVDFSHVGPKFGHEMPARYMEAQSEAHDRALLDALTARNADSFWKESGRVRDQYNVCGFAALACLLDILPACRGCLLGYEIWNEEATRSAVSYAAIAFTVSGK
ncbi:MAG: AmmeMemoRadiSam system protein B [Desulfobacterota bacterium]|nr:AmmeMemoRadiSam system protein B [Thermodesulfobacteriota bacterium]